MSLEEKASKWKKILYVINGLTFIIGAALIGLGVWGRTSEEGKAALVTADWILNVIIAFGAIVLLISFAGICGARVSLDKIANRQTNWLLWIYFIILFIAIILQVVAAAVLLSLAGVLGDAADNKASSAVDKLDREIRSWIASNIPEWRDIQEAFSCCGYNTTDEFGTDLTPPATSCSITNVQPCRVKLVEEGQDQAVIIAAVGIVFILIQLLAFTAACCLLCCIKDTD